LDLQGKRKDRKNFSVPLILPKALEIMEAYSSESDYLLPRISNNLLTGF
jgi:hypothetical protein